MKRIRLATRTRQRLRERARTGANARQVRRAQALLGLDGGASVAAVAQQLGITPRTVYLWIERYQPRRGEPVGERLPDRPRSGRPPRQLASAAKVVGQMLKRDPLRRGYRSPVWTVPMLRAQVLRVTGEKVSLRTVRRALRTLRYRYKRPRFVLARRSRTWRQAKGGSNAG